MAGQLQPISQTDFSGGENTVANPYDLRPNQVQNAVNLILDEHGSLRTRDGTLTQGVRASRPDRPIVKLYDFVQVSGAIRRLAIQLGTIGNNTLWLRDTNPWTSISDFASVYATPDILTFTNLAICAGGNTEPLKSSDGTQATGLVPLTGGPNASHIAVHLGFLWAWNTNNATVGFTGSSSLQSSDLNNPNSWPGGNQTFIAKDDGQSGQGLAQYTIAESGISPTATLIAWKDFSGYECSGVLGVASFSVQKIKSDMGCVAPRSIQFISGFGIVRLSHRGFALYDGVNDTLISEEERPRIFGRGPYTGIDWANVNLSMAAQVANPPLYLCACPLVGSNGRLQRVFCYDLVRRSWTVLNYANDLSTMQLILDPNVLPGVLFGDANKGFVRRAFMGDPDDDGTPITWTELTRAFAGQSPTERTYFRRMNAAFFNLAAGSQVTASFFYSPTNLIGQKTVTVTVPTIPTLTTFAGWGTDPWSTTPWGSQNAPLITDTVLTFDIGATVDSVQVQLQGSGPMTQRAIDVQARTKPISRAVAVAVGV